MNLYGIRNRFSNKMFLSDGKMLLADRDTFPETLSISISGRYYDVVPPPGITWNIPFSTETLACSTASDADALFETKFVTDWSSVTSQTDSYGFTISVKWRLNKLGVFAYSSGDDRIVLRCTLGFARKAGSAAWNEAYASSTDATIEVVPPPSPLDRIYSSFTSSNVRIEMTSATVS